MLPTSIPTQRKLIAGVIFATLLLLGLIVGDLARGGRPDPAVLREQVQLLDGAWKFHTGDDPRWADPAADDRDWETLDLTAAPGSHDGDVGLPDYVGGWMSHGHPGYHGYAWYRRAIDVPAEPRAWDILGPTLVEDGYELYWNGQLLGGSGRIGSDPHLVGTRPLRFTLPDDVAGMSGVLAIRVYKLPGGAGPDGGGLHTPPILAPRPVGEQLHRVQWERTIAGYVVDFVEPLAMFAVIGLAFCCGSREGRRGFVIFACIALALMAARRLNNAIVAWTDLMDLRTYAWLASVMWVPAMAAWLLAWNRWVLPPWRSVDVLAGVLAIAALVGSSMDWAAVTRVSRIAAIALFVVLGVRIARGGRLRILAIATLITIAAALFGGELLDPLGVPGIWFPFGIGVSRTQYVYALAIPLLALLLVRASVLRPQRDAAA